MNLLRFVVLVGVLVFVHELGHFIVARLFGVKVLQFSLGFGPRIFGIQMRETEYRVGILPLGGFVTMLGENPEDPVPDRDRARSFATQSVLRRSLIVLAGPLMSLTFPLFLYFVAGLGQTHLSPPTIGTVVPGHPAEGRLLPGDVVLAINQHEVRTFADIRERIAATPGRPMRFRVQRGEQTLETSVTPLSIKIEGPLDTVEYVGRAGISPGFTIPVIAVRSERSQAAVAGLRSFDLIFAYAGRPVRRWIELEHSLERSRGSTVPVSFARPVAVNAALEGLCDLEVLEPGLAMLTPEPGEGDVASRTGIESTDLYVADVPVQSPEYEMGLRRGDKILLVNGVAPPSWEAVRESLLEHPDRPHSVSFRHEGREVVGGFALGYETLTDEFGQRSRRPSFRSNHWAPAVTEPLIPNPRLLRSAIEDAFAETARALSYLSLAIIRGLQGRVPASTVGGPIAIYDASASTASEGTAGFLRLMALISINLGLLNLLPIPTLDGGHLLFFAIEGVRGRPLSLRVRRLAALAGLIALLALMTLALKNDLQRKWQGAELPTVSAR
ncbi:MAG: RIP metalloprotease RseP [Deltaproteobacteria bacterium]|nr:RIP metalloprotease RseP [Deltaproteobacteria bacterium]